MSLDLLIPRIDKWLATLSPDWRDILVDHASEDGRAIYQLIRCGLAEAKCRFVAWHPDDSFEVWCTTLISGRWRVVPTPNAIKAMFGGRAPNLAQKSYLALRASPAIRQAPLELKEEPKATTVRATGAIIVSIPPVDREIEFASDFKRVERIALFYSRSQFERGSRQPVPTGSIINARLVQGETTLGKPCAYNVAEFEDVDYEPQSATSSIALTFAFCQTVHRCREHLAAAVQKGARGEIASHDDSLLQALGKSCCDLHHAGMAVVQMYQRNGADPTRVAKLIADPLNLGNIETLVKDLDTLAILDDARRTTETLSQSTDSTTNKPAQDDTRQLDDGQNIILETIERAGYFLETIVDTCAKLDEEELQPDPYKPLPRDEVRLPARSMKGAYDDMKPLKRRHRVPEKY